MAVFSVKATWRGITGQPITGKVVSLDAWFSLQHTLWDRIAVLEQMLKKCGVAKIDYEDKTVQVKFERILSEHRIEGSDVQEGDVDDVVWRVARKKQAMIFAKAIEAANFPATFRAYDKEERKGAEGEKREESREEKVNS